MNFVKLICSFINPEAAQRVFKEPDMEIVSTTFVSEIEEQMKKRGYSKEEIEKVIAKLRTQRIDFVETEEVLREE